MKIGFIVTYFHPFTDGTENNCLYLAMELAKKHEVHIFTSDRRDKKRIEQEEEIYQGLHIHRCRTIARYKYYLVWDINLLSKLFKYKLDILHVHSIGFPQQDLAVLLIKIFRRKTKIINTPHGPFLANNYYSIPVKILREIYRILEFPLNKFCYDAVIDVNSKQIKWMDRFGFTKKQIQYCPDGIPESCFKEIDNKEFIKKHNLKNKFVISSLGRLVPYKGFDQVIKVLPEIIKKHPNILYLHMGPDRGDLERLTKLVEELKVKNNIIFLGMASDDEKLMALDKSEIFLFTSEPGTEAFGIVMLEAMARKNALISTKVEGDNILVVEEVNGFIYDHGDLETLKRRLLYLIENKKALKKMQEENYKRSKNFINEEIAWNYLEKIYKGVLGK